MGHLDFDRNGDGEVTGFDRVAEVVPNWIHGGGRGWLPMGPFTAEFNGNGYTIRHFTTSRTARNSGSMVRMNVGLFSSITGENAIQNVGLVEVDVTGDSRVGGLVGTNAGMIRASYVNGEVSGDNRPHGGNPGIDTINRYIGGLVGFNSGTIDVSYATGRVNGERNVGGLAGSNSGTINASYATSDVNGNENVHRYIAGLVGFNSGTIRVSYATGDVIGDRDVGGLAGFNNGTINAGYATGDVSGGLLTGGLVGGNTGVIRASYTISSISTANSISGSAVLRGLTVEQSGSSVHDSYFDTSIFDGGQPFDNTLRRKSTVELRSPTSYTGIYANWNLDLDNADEDSLPLTGGDNPWDFGTSDQYPLLQVDFDGDGFKSWEEFGPQQSRPGISVLPEGLFLMEGEAGTYTVVLLTRPTTSVMVTPVSSSTEIVSVVSGELTFMPDDWNMTQTVAVRAEDDANSVNEVVSLMHTVVSTDPDYMSLTDLPDVTVEVTDDDGGIRVRIRVFLAGPLR